MNRARHPLAILALAGGCAALGAAESRTQIAVSATVVSQAHVDELQGPAAITVTALDVARGFLDVPEPVQLRITCNSRAGYELELNSLLPLFRTITIKGFGDAIEMPLDGTTLTRRGPQTQPVVLTLGFRLTLAHGIAPGRYDWPLRIQVRPLK